MPWGSAQNHLTRVVGGFVTFAGDEKEEVILLDEIKERFVAVIGEWR